MKKDMGEIQRTLLCQGPVELTRGMKMCKKHLSLFSDVLVVSNNLKKRKFKIKHIIPLQYLCAVDNMDIINLVRINEICTCRTLALFWPTGMFLATFSSKEQKDRWYYFIKRSTNEARMGIQKNFSMKIFTEDIPNCDSD
ncbi:rho GTPase-activating protein 20-like [Apodemus sylvaticus]|uniref:rho GTPase-activating protein 20-like n=1 Tax=Apodemus sylvaticus TaxID=10129 RepID=UPI0022434AD5|nr:rho GTPase-activating protein 20-like [Apodemus sylvaticus]